VSGTRACTLSCTAKRRTVWGWRKLKPWSIFIRIVVSCAKDQVQTPCATMMTISSWRIQMMMVEHSQRRTTMTMMATMTTMAMEAKATTAMMEILLMEEENIAERTLQSFLKIRRNSKRC
jgi:hypothetical protein